MKIKIHKPCSESWEAMQDSQQGKFCEICSKCIIDFTNKTDEEITEVFEKADGKEICGRISTKSFSRIAAGIILITNLTFTQAQTNNDFKITTEQKSANITILSGKLIFKRNRKEIQNAEVFFVCKSKYIKTITDIHGNFVLEIPNELIERRNVLYFDFEKLNRETRENPKRQISNILDGDIYEDTSIIFTKTEGVNNKEFQIDSKNHYVGGVAIMQERPPDYYYFNGKSTTKRKFEKLKKENPNYKFFFFNEKEGEIISKKSYLNSIQLLYSN